MGQRWPIVCLYLEPVMIFHFLIEETQQLMRKCLPTLCIAHIIWREKMYIVKLFQNIFIVEHEHWKSTIYSSQGM